MVEAAKDHVAQDRPAAAGQLLADGLSWFDPATVQPEECLVEAAIAYAAAFGAHDVGAVLPWARYAYDNSRRVFPPGHARIAVAVETYVTALDRAGDRAAMILIEQELMELLPAERISTDALRLHLARTLHEDGQCQQALREAAALLEAITERQPILDGDTAVLVRSVAAMQHGCHQHDLAAQTIALTVPGNVHGDLRNALGYAHLSAAWQQGPGEHAATWHPGQVCSHPACPATRSAAPTGGPAARVAGERDARRDGAPMTTAEQSNRDNIIFAERLAEIDAVGPAAEVLADVLRGLDPATAPPEELLIEAAMVYSRLAEPTPDLVPDDVAWAGYAHRAARARYGPGHATTLAAMENLASVLYARGRFDEANRVRRDLIQLHLDYGNIDAHLIQRMELADQLHAAGRCEDAIRQAQAAWQDWISRHDPTSPDTLRIMLQLVAMLLACDRFEDAVAVRTLAQFTSPSSDDAIAVTIPAKIIQHRPVCTRQDSTATATTGQDGVR
ncbi:hypothetical protein ACQP2P_16465 [Dactylosporangium sp. CA-139114]|uniref:hypothetical protein n=1 Tax=Dactylosporangium sp. CA-139114 TaxID=3239931 RepID=UPI003D98AEF9